MSRFGWAFVNDVIIGTGSAGTGSSVDGPTHAVVVRDGGIVSGATNFNFNNAAGIGQLTGSLYITNNLTITGNLYTGPTSTTTLIATTYVSASSITGTLRSNTGNKFGSLVGDIHQFTGSIAAGIVSGTTAQFSTVTGSTVTSSVLYANTATIPTLASTNITNSNNIATSVLNVTGATNSIISGRNINSLGSVAASSIFTSLPDPIKPDNNTVIYIKPDGSRAYFHDDLNNQLLYASLTTPWDISTLQTTFNLAGANVPTSSGTALGLTFKPDGTKGYILLDNKEVWQADVTVPWNFDSANWGATKKVTLSGSAGALGQQRSLIFSENGEYLFTCSGSSIIRYVLPTPWEVGTIVHTSYTTASAGLSLTTAKDISLTNDGKSLILIDSSNVLYDFELGSSYDLTTIIQKGNVSLDSITTATYPIAPNSSMFLKPDQTKIYFYSLNGPNGRLISLSMTSSQVDLVGGIHITGDAKITQNINVYGDATFEDLSGSNAQFRVLSGSLVNLTTVTGSSISSSIGQFTQLTASSADINGGTIDATSIGASSQSTGRFTSLSASSTLDVAGATTIAGNLTVNGGKTSVQTFSASAGLSGNIGQFGILTSSATLLTGATSVGGNLVPNANNAYDLGSSGNRWRDIYVSSSINVPNISAVNITASNVMRTTGSNAYIVVGTGSTNTIIEIAHTGANDRGIRFMSGSTEKWFAGANQADNYVVRYVPTSPVNVITFNSSSQNVTLSWPLSGTVITASSVQINGGAINGTINGSIGTGTPSLGKFTEVSASIGISASNAQFAYVISDLTPFPSNTYRIGQSGNSWASINAGQITGSTGVSGAAGQFGNLNASIARIADVNISGNYLYTDTPDISSYSYSSLSGTITTDTTLTGIYFKHDGSTLYTMGDNLNKISLQLLTNKWDISSFEILSSSSPTLSSKAYSGLFVSPDGYNFYTQNTTDDLLHQYTSSARDDVTSINVTPKNTFALESVLGTAVGLIFKPDGTKLIYSDFTSGRIYQRTLTTPWEINTLSATSTNYLVGASQLRGVTISSDGRKLYATIDTSSPNEIKEYYMTTPWDVTTLTPSGFSLNVASQTTAPQYVYMSPNNQYIFVSDTAEKIYQYSTNDIKTIDLNANTNIAGELNVNFVNINEGLNISDKISISTKPIYKRGLEDGFATLIYENVIVFSNDETTSDLSGLIFDNYFKTGSINYGGFIGTSNEDIRIDRINPGGGINNGSIAIKSDGIVLDARNTTSESITFTGSIYYSGVRKVISTSTKSLTTEDYFVIISGSTAFNFGIPNANLHTGRQIIFRNETGVGCSLSSSDGSAIFKTGTGGTGAITTVPFSGTAGQTSITLISDGTFWHKISGT